jgi:hypothetical protein
MPSIRSDRRDWISPSFTSDAFISSPMPPTSAITADVSSPFPSSRRSASTGRCGAPGALRYGSDRTAFRFEGGERGDVEGVAAIGEALRDAVEVFAQQLDVEHGRTWKIVV